MKKIFTIALFSFIALNCFSQTYGLRRSFDGTPIDSFYLKEGTDSLYDNLPNGSWVFANRLFIMDYTPFWLLNNLPTTLAGHGITNAYTKTQSDAQYQPAGTYLTSESDPLFNTKFAAKTTDGLAEGSANLYWTSARFNTAFAGKNTDGLSEGASNFYFTNARFDTRLVTKTTSNLTEGSNLYFTNARAQNAISLTTTGTSGAASYAGGVLNIPNYTFGYGTANNAPGRSLVTVAAAANGFQISATKAAIVNYSVTILSTVSLSGNATGYAVFEICPTNSSTASDWLEIGRTPSGQSGTLVVGLVLNQTGGGQVGGYVPVGYYSRIRTINSVGTPTFTYNSGQEYVF